MQHSSVGNVVYNIVHMLLTLGHFSLVLIRGLSQFVESGARDDDCDSTH